MGDYRSLKVWQKAHRLALAVYRDTEHFPKSEMFGLTSQLRRAAGSIPSNLAEGSGRDSDRELIRYCRISLGSASELDYHLLLARDLGLLPADRYDELASATTEVRRMLAALIDALRCGLKTEDWRLKTQECPSNSPPPSPPAATNLAPSTS
jgi:four helix bundle protein